MMVDFWLEIWVDNMNCLDWLLACEADWWSELSELIRYILIRSAQNNRGSWFARVWLNYNSFIARSLPTRVVNETSWLTLLVTRRVRVTSSSDRGYLDTSSHLTFERERHDSGAVTQSNWKCKRWAHPHGEHMAWCSHAGPRCKVHIWNIIFNVVSWNWW
jgi:hypothetical protein